MYPLWLLSSLGEWPRFCLRGETWWTESCKREGMRKREPEHGDVQSSNNAAAVTCLRSASGFQFKRHSKEMSAPSRHRVSHARITHSCVAGLGYRLVRPAGHTCKYLSTVATWMNSKRASASESPSRGSSLPCAAKSLDTCGFLGSRGLALDCAVHCNSTRDANQWIS